ncbi:MAG: hypothetical protein IPN69_16080 [Acidobacteria bacterium]|nr:hypothetical protein [Acidobacteriota bacterium]
MKTLLRVFAVTMFLTTVGIVSANAQDTTEKCPDLAACFELFKAELNKPCGTRDKAIEYGEYIGEKFKDDVENAELVAKIKGRAAKLKNEDEPPCKRIAAYNDNFKAKRWDDFLSVSKEIMNDPKTDPSLGLDIMLTHVSIGYDRIVEKSDKYNNETVMYAKTAIQKIESGVMSKNLKWGTYDPFGSKENALSWLNYTIGFINYYRLSSKDEGIKYFYKASRSGEKKTDPAVFQEIGFWYTAKAAEFLDESKKIFEANNKTVTDEAKAKLALARAYAERAVDAFGRAQSLAKDAKLRTEITETLTEVYKIRFNGKVDGMDKYVSEAIAKPMPDPASAPAPVILEETTSTVPETPVVTVSKTTTVATTTKPVVKATTPTATTVKPAAAVKKPAPKKKGTR